MSSLERFRNFLTKPKDIERSAKQHTRELNQYQIDSASQQLFAKFEESLYNIDPQPTQTILPGYETEVNPPKPYANYSFKGESGQWEWEIVFNNEEADNTSLSISRGLKKCKFYPESVEVGRSLISKSNEITVCDQWLDEQGFIVSNLGINTVSAIERSNQLIEEFQTSQLHPPSSDTV